MTTITWEQLQDFIVRFHDILEDVGTTDAEFSDDVIEEIFSKSIKDLLNTLDIGIVTAPRGISADVITDAYVNLYENVI